MSMIIFVPSFIYDENSGYLLGSIHSYNCEQSDIKAVVIHGKLQDNSENEQLESVRVWEDTNTVGYFYSENSTFYFLPKKQDWISLTIQRCNLTLKEVLRNGSIINPNDCRLVIYDKNVFLKSELLSNQIRSMRIDEIYNNYFLILLLSLRNANSSVKSDSLSPIVFILYRVFRTLNSYSTLAMPILKFSALGLHFHNFFYNIAWAFSSLIKERNLTLKVGNYLLAVLFDMTLGTLALYYLQNVYAMPEFFEVMSRLSQDAVVSLKNLIEWIMGSPAGLKLNFPLNSVLGNFFLYHIDLWWLFLGLVRPFLEFGFYLLLLIGRLGITFQTAMLADFLALASFHVYCIYVYAARLYNLQLNGLASLSRLFIGCRRNPLPGKVDSCPYTTEQLFVGTIAFTVLLFLLPTTLVYYIVFTALRLLVIIIGGILTRGRFLLQSLPIYVFGIWLFSSAVVTSSFQMTPKMDSGSLVLYVQPICSSLWRIIYQCVPDPIERPAEVEWRKLTRNLIMGNLIYPM